ncbi:MAG: alpha/beta hydrolase [Bacteroidia bacterium]
MISQNISYAADSPVKNLLDVIYDKDKKGLPVIFFVHGGSWMSGSKDMYTRLGENFLEKGMVSVIISYRLFPDTDVFGMVEDSRAALKWCIEHISEFGGDKNKIYLMGHSAGGHLAAVAGLSEKEPQKHIAGFIMVDAFGLSAHHFLSEYSMMMPEFFANVFGKQKEKWYLVSPDKLIRKDLPPFLILTGGSTYPFLVFDNKNFAGLLGSLNVSCKHITLPYLSHMQMIFQFENKRSEIYDVILKWMKTESLPVNYK